jgi:hypothetical protein
MKAIDDASRHYNASAEKERKAFFHGLLTGYAGAFQRVHVRGWDKVPFPRWPVDRTTDSAL